MPVHPRELSIADFTYHLPDARIAKQALAERDASKLLVYANGVIKDRVFRDLPSLLPEGALLVLNDTRVVNARLLFRYHTGANIEVFCMEPTDEQPVETAFAQRGNCTWNAMVGNSKRWKAGDVLSLEADGFTLVAEREQQSQVSFRWTPAEATFAEVLAHVGHVPLPPYMQRPDTEDDRQRYNTVFAQQDGSVAAPTASLHFSQHVLAGLQAAGVSSTRLTLHVGAGTFLPVKSELLADHAMHSEQLRVPLDALMTIQEQLSKGPIIAVGTTALRTLESLYWHGVKVLKGEASEVLAVEQWEPYSYDEERLPNAEEALQAVIEQVKAMPDQRLTGSTQLLVAPGYAIRMAQGLITNFHQPNSTLLLLVAAFVGTEWRKVYEHALANDYRFLSYGDGSLLWRSER